jgi:uncharacterized membrane protein
VFGLALGFSAFSLTEFPMTTENEVLSAIGLFTFTFFVISLFWIWNRRFFEEFPIHGERPSFILWILSFCVAILPFIVRLFFASMFGGAEEIAYLAQTVLYPLDMAAISIFTGIIHVVFLSQARSRTPWDDYEHIANDTLAAFVLGFGFILWLFIPLSMTMTELLPIDIPDPFGVMPARLGIWILIGIAATPLYIIVKATLKKMKPLE